MSHDYYKFSNTEINLEREYVYTSNEDQLREENKKLREEIERLKQ